MNARNKKDNIITKIKYIKFKKSIYIASKLKNNIQ